MLTFFYFIRTSTRAEMIPGYVLCDDIEFERRFSSIRCTKERIDFAIIGNQSEIDFFLVLVMRTTTLVFSAVFLFLRIPRIFAIAPLSSLLIFSAIDFRSFISFPGRRGSQGRTRAKNKNRRAGVLQLFRYFGSRIYFEIS